MRTRLAYLEITRSPNILKRQFFGCTIFGRPKTNEIKEPTSPPNFWTAGQDQKLCRTTASETLSCGMEVHSMQPGRGPMGMMKYFKLNDSVFGWKLQRF